MPAKGEYSHFLCFPMVEGEGQISLLFSVEDLSDFGEKIASYDETIVLPSEGAEPLILLTKEE